MTAIDYYLLIGYVLFVIGVVFASIYAGANYHIENHEQEYKITDGNVCKYHQHLPAVARVTFGKYLIDVPVCAQCRDRIARPRKMNGE